MLDLKIFFNNFDYLVERLSKRNVSKEELINIKEKIKEKKNREKYITKLREKRNNLKGIEFSDKVKEIKKEIKEKEEELKNFFDSFEIMISNLPNIPDLSVPEEDKLIEEVWYDSVNKEIGFEKIIKRLPIIDEEKSIMLSGSKFVVYKELGSSLLHALINFMLFSNKEKGYKIFDVPYMIHSRNFYNSGQLPKFEKDLYKIENSDYYLIPTAEVSLISLFQKKTFNKESLPLNVCSYSPCFRAEKMSYGENNSILKRLHQFNKVELVKIVEPENSNKELEKIIEAPRYILDKLKITYRLIELCCNNLSTSAKKGFDLECFSPVSKTWIELSSCSNCGDFQSRRAKIKIINEKKEKYFSHTLNGSSLAIDRLIMLICEYYYDEKKNDIKIPEILKKYFFY